MSVNTIEFRVKAARDIECMGIVGTAVESSNSNSNSGILDGNCNRTIPTRMITTAEEAKPEVSDRTISIRQTIPDISEIARSAVCASA